MLSLTSRPPCACSTRIASMSWRSTASVKRTSAAWRRRWSLWARMATDRSVVVDMVPQTPMVGRPSGSARAVRRWRRGRRRRRRGDDDTRRRHRRRRRRPPVRGENVVLALGSDTCWPRPHWVTEELLESTRAAHFRRGGRRRRRQRRPRSGGGGGGDGNGAAVQQRAGKRWWWWAEA